MAEIDWDRPIETTDGRPVRVVCHDRACADLDAVNRVVLVNNDGYEDPFVADNYGNCFGDADHGEIFIRNVPPRMAEREAWGVRGGDGYLLPMPYPTKDEAERYLRLTMKGCGAVVRLTWQEPEAAPKPEAESKPDLFTVLLTKKFGERWWFTATDKAALHDGIDSWQQSGWAVEHIAHVKDDGDE